MNRCPMYNVQASISVCACVLACLLVSLHMDAFLVSQHLLTNSPLKFEGVQACCIVLDNEAG